ncbi:DUF412 domain-containing protein [Paraneptunicella aestuarii]|uniref:terminus macrodomain insulation protein YfbV n=1 Tax=Paraneptunicella aestuarii TaxID=2831148 RepID=UPI001E2962C9|nr:terminus macrodomain insulation protein YfbV [Paraneptunicella aestuarii]UAA40490.1 DUF412 domain-containing protein [Paraneptunicella aestuarii]
MAHTFTSLVRDGQSYMKDWPLRKELYALFPESRVINATRFSLKWMPPLSLICASVMVEVNGAEYLPQAIAIVAFFLSLPLQGLLWLGHRSHQMLPPSIRAWYQDIHSKMREQGCDLAAAKSRPSYRELALLLKKAFKELDRAFTRQWF